MTKKFKHKDIISIRDLTKEEIIYLLRLAEKIKKLKNKGGLLKGKIMASLFFEPSTRTRFSFESAMKHLGGEVLSFENMETTSVTKGESLYDTVKMMERYADVIVIRHNLEGAARFTAEATKRPVINAGDGANQHPTQTLLDLFTIQECQKKLNNLTIAMVGDLKYGRTVHSLTQALAHFKSKFYFISPASLKMPEAIKEELRENKIKFSELESFDRILNKVDILYMTRIQKERFADPLDYEKVKNAFILKAGDLTKAKPNLKVLHPLPRVNEIDKKVDDTKHAYYFQQAQNGLYLRQALLALLLNKIS